MGGIPTVNVNDLPSIPSVSIDDLPNAGSVSVNDLPDVSSVSVETDPERPGVLSPDSTVTLTSEKSSEATSAEEFVFSKRYARYGTEDERLKLVNTAPRIAPLWKGLDHYAAKIRGR